jgi:probable HAF family extracellular repeat protein
MRMLRLIFAVLLMIVAVSSLSVAQQYTVTDLGTLGGKGSGATAINDQGVAVGSAQVASGIYHAFLWSSTTGMIDLGLLHENDSSTVATGINNSGLVVGIAYNPTTVESAFLWTESAGMGHACRQDSRYGGSLRGASSPREVTPCSFFIGDFRSAEIPLRSTLVREDGC